MGLIRRVAAAALLANATMPLWAAEPLSLPQAQQLAAARSQQLLAQDASAKAAREMAVSAGQLPDPVLKLGVTNLPADGPDQFSLTRDFMTMRSVGVMQEITRSDKRQARSARLEREAETAEAGRRVALASLQRETAIAWLDRFYQERMRGLLRTQRDEAKLQIEAADALYRGGRGSQADLFAARSAVAQLDDRLALADRQIETATTQLARWVGAEAAKPLGAPPALDRVSLHSGNLESQLANQPEIDVLMRKEATAQADVELALANKKSDVSVELMYSQRGPAFSNMVSINMSIPLQWNQKNRQDRELGARLALLEQVRAEREEGTRMQVAQTLAMLQEWRSNRERLGRYDASLLPLTSERTRAAIAAYRGAAGSLTAVLEARRGEVDMQMERLRLEMDTARLWAQINYLIPAAKDMAFNAHP
ncbi:MULTISPECIES: TolC family protein [unclassified Polaromonas]|uniref:TolC family protein n=1 Tax=unclassified Polaromonas TaxID=2638319 RepID=UPI001A333DC5|nr:MULTISPECIES: TolC family protein [unclassified Polaromonas]MBG6072647.1 outer membrane protein TolC [Polaromonas sp. CG_9.7]MBG6114633.1 outer membrane protein TolC [Polaromonas sp. CG_9.2]MDH6185203.1 outer membrane protein TolC [Polaromonas sp. CG_23.6]